MEEKNNRGGGENGPGLTNQLTVVYNQEVAVLSDVDMTDSCQ